VFGVLVICACTTLLAEILTHAANPNPNCLNIEHDRTVILDPTTGNTYVVNQPQDRASTDSAQIPAPELAWAYSTDGKRLAYFTNYSQTGLATIQFEVPALVFWRMHLLGNDPVTGEIQWSPDNQWIAYRWPGDDGKQYLAIADPYGHNRSLTALDSTVDGDKPFVRWSPDAKYIAVINDGRPGQTGRIRFFSAPDLKAINPGETLSAGCENPPDSPDSSLHCYPWSMQGHTAAYIVDNDAKVASLVMVNVGDLTRRIFPLPPAGIRTTRLSPDGQHAAVMSFVFGDTMNTTTDGEFDVYNSNGTVAQKIDNVAFANFGDSSRRLFAQVEWSPDDKFVVYDRHDPDASSQMQVMLYRPETAEKRVLLTGLVQDYYEDYYDFGISSDSQYIAVFARYIYEENELSLVRADGKSSQWLGSGMLAGDQPVFLQVQWSPDGKMLAFATEHNPNRGDDMIIKVVGQDGKEIRQLRGDYIDTLQWTACDQP